MKNIIIVGPSRSGKSTLAKRINEELGFFVLSTDKLVAIFENAYPSLDIRLNWDRDKTTENLAPFLGHFLGMFSADDGKGLLDYSHGTVKENHFVLEGAYYDFEKVESVLKLYGIENIKDRFHLIGLVQREKSADDFYSDFIKFDTEDDWTYSLSDDELKNVSEEAVSYNEEMYEKLTEYGFDIYDTSKERDKVFAEILERVKENE